MRKDGESKKRSGLMILTSKEFQVQQIHAKAIQVVELLELETKTTEGDIIIAIVYMPHQTRASEKKVYTELIGNTQKA